MSGAVENCPFCGSDEVGLFRPSDYRTGANNRDWYVQCFGCHVETAEYLTEAEAVIAWNTRTTPPARSYADGAGEELDRWTILRKEIESERTASIPKWAEHLLVGGYREQGWAAFDQTNRGCMFASGKWGDSLVLFKDGTIRLLSQDTNEGNRS